MSSDGWMGALTSMFGLMMVGAIAKQGLDMMGNMKSNANFFDWKLK